MKIMQKLGLITALILTSLFTTFGCPWLVAPAVAQSFSIADRVIGYVFRVNVSDLDTAINFYEKKLDMKRNKIFDTKEENWTQFYYPNFSSTQIGVYKEEPQSTGNATITLVVDNIEEVRTTLLGRDIKVSPIVDAGSGVKLAFFQDDDGNRLAIREEHPIKKQQL